jgi:hypothetical protein
LSHPGTKREFATNRDMEATQNDIADPLKQHARRTMGYRPTGSSSGRG